MFPLQKVYQIWGVIFTLLLLSLLPTQYCSSKPSRLITKLIHHCSVDSPFFNSSATVLDRFSMEMKISEARIKYLSSLKGDTFDDIKMRVALVADPSIRLFTVRVMIGLPLLPQYLAFDTGSSMTWVTCNDLRKCPHDTCPARIPYDPSLSSTYTPLRCHTPECDLYSGPCGDEENDCPYTVNYTNGVNIGTLGRERFLLSSERNESVMRLVFGCSRYTTLDLTFDGVLGLGNLPISILSQNEYSLFAYCIGNLSDPYNMDNVLIMQEGSMTDINYTPLLYSHHHFQVRLEQISVAGKDLGIVMERDSRGLAVLDTGSSLSLLTEKAYLALETAVIQLIGTSLDRVDRPGQLCYMGKLHRDLHWFPSVAFHFTWGISMEFGYENLFQQRNPYVVCLGVRDAADYNMDKCLIGANLQQGYYMEYNVARRRLGLKVMACAALREPV